MPYFIFLLLFLAVPLTCSAAEVPYSAIVLDVKGKVEVQRDRKKMPVDLGYLLYAGDMVETAKGASVTVQYLESGQEEQWPGKMKFTIDKLRSRPALSSVITKNKKIVLPRLENPQAGVFRLRSHRPRGVGNNHRVKVKDLANTCTLEERPVFRWSSVSGADSYQVTLYLYDGNKLLWRKSSVGAELPYPTDEPPLNADSRYEWNVEAFRNHRVIAEKRSCFYLPKREESTTMNQQITLYQQQLASNPGDTVSRLKMIFFLENFHLYDYALEQYSALRRIHGESESLKLREEKLIRLMQLDCTFSAAD
jgi:hypothetical protein